MAQDKGCVHLLCKWSLKVKTKKINLHDTRLISLDSGLCTAFYCSLTHPLFPFYWSELASPFLLTLTLSTRWMWTFIASFIFQFSGQPSECLHACRELYLRYKLAGALARVTPYLIHLAPHFRRTTPVCLLSVACSQSNSWLHSELSNMFAPAFVFLSVFSPLLPMWLLACPSRMEVQSILQPGLADLCCSVDRIHARIVPNTAAQALHASESSLV